MKKQNTLAASLLVRYDGRERGEWEVYPGVGHEVRLELLEVDVERTLEAQRGRRRGHDLGHHPVLVWMAGVSFGHVARLTQGCALSHIFGQLVCNGLQSILRNLIYLNELSFDKLWWFNTPEK